MRVNHGLQTKLERSNFLIDHADEKKIIIYIENLTLINLLKEHPVQDSELCSFLKQNLCYADD